MKDESSIFDAEPENLDRLVFEILGEPEAEEDSGSSATVDGVLEHLGGQIGRYKLLSVLGEGGMGIVYLAEQKHPIRRQVALKVIKPGMDSKRVIARFEAERQALAILDHPNIAHVHDAGTTENGRPYFVMEYVKGLSITEHCDSHKLTIEKRLRLFQQVCQAVHHAHQKGIIHRDIKTSNILVSLQDDQVIPKIIDFGVAKALAQPLTERTLVIEQGQLFGTPEYMSPEQADMANEDIDTRSDIYSLGVLLYVLLIGVLPFDSTTFREGGIEHIRQVIRETDPKTPSTRLSSLGEEAKKVAQSRQIEVAALAKRLHKELEWIPLKAMRKERTERYRSASELADDIENYLKGAALIAGPPSNVYRLKKFVRRHRGLVAGVAAVLVVFASGVVVSLLFALGQARARAEAQAVSEFLRYSVLQSLDPFWVGGRQITIRSILDAASSDLEEKFTGTPLAEADIRNTLGYAYWSLGLYEQSESHHTRGLELGRAHLGNLHPTTLEWMQNLGWAYFYQSRYNEAEKLFREALEGMQRVLGEEDQRTLYSMWSLACVSYMQGRFQEADQLSVKSMETFCRQWGEENRDAPSYINVVALGCHLQGRYDEAERLFTKALEISRRLRGEKDWYTLILRYRFGELCWDLGRYEEAEQHLLEALNGRRDAWGPEHPETVLTMTALGWLYHIQGRYEEAESTFNKVLETSGRVLGDAHLISLHAMHGFGTLYLTQERYDEAKPLLVKALEIGHNLLGEENWYTVRVMNSLAKLYAAQGRYEEAEKTFWQTLECRKRIWDANHPEIQETMNDLGVLYTVKERYDQAFHLLTEALDGRHDKLGKDHPETLESKNDLAVLYKEQARYDEAEKLLLEALEGRRLKLGDTHPHTLESWNNLIELYEAWDKPEQAEEWREELRIVD